MEEVSDDQNFTLTKLDKRKRSKSIRYLDAAVPLDYAGTTVWVSDEMKVWVEALVVEQNSNMIRVKKDSQSDYIEIDCGFDEIHKLNSRVVADMAELNFLHEPGILYNICQRALSRNPYTYMGTVLIAVNPLRSLPVASISDYIDTPLNKETPHPYALAELAYQQLCYLNSNQCLVVSGESGAGKTETAKILLKFIADRSPLLQATATSDIDKRMLQSSPLLESFGNAKTGRNDNSSRFGKLMKIFFKPNLSLNIDENAPNVSKNKMALVGVAIETYLLEKSRVVGQNEGERNYHVFYQILAAISANDSTLSSDLSLTADCRNYRILQDTNISIANSSRGINDDYSNFKSTYSSLQALGMAETEIQGVFSTLAGLLHLGNVTFVVEETQAGEKAIILDKQSLQYASNCLGFTVEMLEKLLTQRLLDVTANNTVSQFTVRLTVKEATYARDACIKSIYTRLFDFIVNRINDNLSSGQDLKKTTTMNNISILDIYGFETYEVNTYEQFLINYANESLQNTFNVQIFDSELRVFAEENITCHISSKPENNGCIEMIAARSNSVLSILDSICQLPQPTDQRFIDELHKNMAGNRFFPPVHVKDKKNTFFVKHFAGKIKYTVGAIDNDKDNASKISSESHSWVSKNNDTSPGTLKEVCDASISAVVRALYSNTVYYEDLTDDPSSSLPVSNMRRRASRKSFRGPIPSTDALKTASQPASSAEGSYSPRSVEQRNQLNKTTIATSFSHSMFKLNSYLVQTNCLFIRCIKPNVNMEVDVMDNEFIVNQLRALGILQTCEVLKLGMPTRIPYRDLVGALQPLLNKLPKELIDTTEEITLIACLMWAFDVKNDLYKLGRTRVFFRAGQFETIEKMLQVSRGPEFETKSVELIARIKQATEFRKAMDKRATDLKKVIVERQGEVNKYRDEIARALMHISKAPQKVIETPLDMVALVSGCEKSIQDSKRYLGQLNTDGHQAIQAVGKIQIDLLDAAIMKDYERLKTDLDMLNKKVQKLCAHHTRTMTRFDALSGRNDRVKDVADSLNDVIEYSDNALGKALERVVEVQDGGQRCDFTYAEERAKLCEDSLEQVRFKLEGVGLDLKDIFDVFGDETRRVDVQVGLNFVKKIFLHEVKTHEDVNKELLEYLSIASRVLQTANFIFDPSSNANPNAKKLEKLKSVSEMISRSKSIRMNPIVLEKSSSDRTISPRVSPRVSPRIAPDAVQLAPPLGALGRVAEEGAVSPQSPPPPSSNVDSQQQEQVPPLAAAASNTTTASLPSSGIPVPINGVTLPPPPPAIGSSSDLSPSKKADGTNRPPLSIVTPLPPVTHVELTPEAKGNLQRRANLAAKAAEQNLIDDALASSESTFPLPTKTPRPHTDLVGGNRNTPGMYSARASISSLRLTKDAQPMTPVSAGGSSRITMSVRMSPSSSNAALPNNINPTNHNPKKRLSFAGSAASIIAGGGLDLAFFGGKTRTSTADETAADVTLATQEGSLGSNEGELPEGWREYFDSTTKRAYYVHRVTKARQWRRPTRGSSPDPSARKQRRGSTRSEAADSDTTESSLHESTLASLSIATRDSSFQTSGLAADRNSIMSVLRADLGSVQSRLNRSGLMKQSGSRREQELEIIHAVKDLNLRIGQQSGCLTITRMEEMGCEPKKGFLMKKSSVLGRWRKRWFVLEGGRFEYFDRPQDETSHTGKAFLLNPHSLTTYTTTENCFCIKANEDSDESRHWKLLAKDSSELERWMMALNSHIHVLYAQENGIFMRSELWEEGTVEPSFWRVLKSSVSKRTYAKTDAPRTGEFFTPGETFECVQSLKADFNTYLRLWGDRGWVFEKHPKARYPLIERVNGQFVEVDARLSEYVCVSKSAVAVYSGPSLNNSKVMSGDVASYTHGLKLRISGMFKEYADGRESRQSMNIIKSDIMFYKLADGSGWVPSQDPTTKAPLFEKAT